MNLTLENGSKMHVPCVFRSLPWECLFIELIISISEMSISQITGKKTTEGKLWITCFVPSFSYSQKCFRHIWSWRILQIRHFFKVTCAFSSLHCWKARELRRSVATDRMECLATHSSYTILLVVYPIECNISKNA